MTQSSRGQQSRPCGFRSMMHVILMLVSATQAFNQVYYIKQQYRIQSCQRCLPRRLFQNDIPTEFDRLPPLLSTATSIEAKSEEDDKLPTTMIPILLSVLALIVSEGIALSTLPLHLTAMGATPAVVGLSTSAFSIAQMVCCPLIVSMSSRAGRRKILGLCLLGASISSGVIASANSIPTIIFARFLAGAFAAAIPVAQAGVTDLVPARQAAIALSRVSAASQTGLVIGPIASAFMQGLLTRLGVPAKYTVRGVFGASAFFALVALAVGGAGADPPVKESKPQQDNSAAASSEAKGSPESIEATNTPTYAQPLLRVMAVAAGWALSLSVSTYSLFSSKFLGYAQTELSTAMSLGAATTIATQMVIVPRLVRNAGEHLSGTLGLWILTLGLAGSSLIRNQPLHALLYLLIRVGTGITDTATAALVARYSTGSDERATNLGMIQSSRAAARIFLPVISGSLFARSCLQKFPPPGSLPYIINAGLACALAPVPLFLKKMESKPRE